MHSQLITGRDRVCPVLQRLWATIVQLVTQPGRHDLVSSFLITGGLLAPLWATPVAAQVGASATEQLLCSGPVNVAQILTVGLGLLSAYYILKGFLRIQFGTDNYGATELVGNDGIRRTDAVEAYSRRQVRGGFYAIGAALLPVFVPVLLNVAGIDVVACLFP